MGNSIWKMEKMDEVVTKKVEDDDTREFESRGMSTRRMNSEIASFELKHSSVVEDRGSGDEEQHSEDEKREEAVTRNADDSSDDEDSSDGVDGEVTQRGDLTPILERVKINPVVLLIVMG